MEVYADNAATTAVSPKVIEAMMGVYQEQYGNPSSIHKVGRSSRHIIDTARRTAAKSINAHPREIIFTSGATESNNTAIKGVAYKNQHKGKHLITTAIEHHSVLHVFEYLESVGFEVTYLPVNSNGEIEILQLQQALRADTILVSIMFGNNEIGSIQPIDEIGEILKDHQAIFHVDAVQAFGHLQIDVNAYHIDLLSLTAHKFHGPKGVGLLYVKTKTPMEYSQLGGAQETKRRAGTENVPLIHGMSVAMSESIEHLDENNLKLIHLKETLINALQALDIPFEINGDINRQLAHIINIYFPFSNVELMLTLLDMAGVYVSSGSACTAGSIEPSHVLTAMYGDDPRTKQSIRISLTHEMTEEEMQFIADQIKKIYEMNQKEAIKE